MNETFGEFTEVTTLTEIKDDMTDLSHLDIEESFQTKFI